MSPVDKVALAMQYNIKDWLLPALNAIAQWPKPIGAGDVDRLGLDVALKIASVREEGYLILLHSNYGYDQQQLPAPPPLPLPTRRTVGAR
ncbi:hypothetical protein BDN67DRAFT_1014319 [Paxillus ammoniavirescens]|nr:hypothetical protein BDN67DRAFT_1014319 [Paxillus ammoniavirescens]